MNPKSGRLALAVVAALALTLPAPPAAAATTSLNVNLASVTRPATGVGSGFLYGMTGDGTQPASQFLTPLAVNAFRGGGHVSRGWIGDGNQFGSGTRADLNSVIAQARRLGPSVQYQVILSDLYGADGGQPSNTMWPCDNGSCANWVSFIDSVVGALQASGLPFAYDIWNEPDISVFWARGMNSAQYFQMWDTAQREIRRIASGTRIVGPSVALTPQNSASEWQTWLAHVKAAGTLPDMITNHDEGDGDDPVIVSQAVNNALSTAGVSPLPLSANEYQPQNQQTAGQSAYFLARFAQSGYTNAMRGNWVCCLIPNLAGILTQTSSGWQATGHWWVMRSYADLTGSLVATSGEVGTLAISAAADSARRRAVALLGDENGFTGAASVTFTGLSSVSSWLSSNGSVHVTVDRIPDQAPLAAPQVVLDQDMTTASGSITVPLTFQATHDAFAVYLTPTQSTGGGFPGGNHQLVVANDNLCLDVAGNTTAAGAAIDQWTCNGQTNQRFQFLPGSGGAGELRAENSGDDVAVANNATAAGSPDIVQQVPNGSAGGLWQPIAQSDGSFEFQNRNSGLCLDVFGAGGNTGQQLDQWACKNAPGTNQDFFPR
ncbi:MAG TPA: RICIN domain-containing protein [Pseudonocardiaceae bacterium]